MATKNNKKILAGLQTIVTALSRQADGHAIQSRVFASEGFTRLAEKYAEHAAEERGYVDKCIDRILDLGGEVRLEATQAGKIIKDPVEWVKYDYQVSRDGLAWLAALVEEARSDFSTYDLLKEYYEDEEEDMYWGETQLDLIAMIGKQNWLVQQL